jgi:hypothetical protein
MFRGNSSHGGVHSAVVHTPVSAGEQLQNGRDERVPAGTAYFDSNSDYRVVRPGEPNLEEWWGRGDAAVVGDLSEPPSPTHYLASPNQGGGHRNFHYEYGSPRHDLLQSPPIRDGNSSSATSDGRSPLQFDGNARMQHSPRQFRRDLAGSTSVDTIHPTPERMPTGTAYGAAVQASGGRQGAREDGSMDGEDKVKLWLPNAGEARSAQPRLCTLMCTGDECVAEMSILSTCWYVWHRHTPDERMPSGSAYEGGGGDERLPSGSAYGARDPTERIPSGSAYAKGVSDLSCALPVALAVRGFGLTGGACTRFRTLWRMSRGGKRQKRCRPAHLSRRRGPAAVAVLQVPARRRPGWTRHTVMLAPHIVIIPAADKVQRAQIIPYPAAA